MEYRLANGSAITDEDIERECAEYESGSWEGNLVNLRADRSKLSEGEPNTNLYFKFPRTDADFIEEAADIKAYNEALMEDDATRYSMDDVIRKPSRMCANMPPWISRSWKYPSQMISQMRGIPERAWQNELQEPAMRRVSPVANGSTLLQLKRFSSVAGISRQNHPINRSAIKEQIS